MATISSNQRIASPLGLSDDTQLVWEIKVLLRELLTQGETGNFPESSTRTPGLTIFSPGAGNTPAGVVEIFASDRETIGLYGLATLLSFRGRGIGKALMTYALNLALRNGYQQAVLQASEDGIGIYERLGFREITTFYEYA